MSSPASVVTAQINAGAGVRSRRGASLSKTIIVGMSALIDLLIIVGIGIAIYFIYKPDSLLSQTRYMAVIGIYTAALLQGFHHAGLYRFSSIVHPLRQIGKITGISVLVFLLMIGIAFALKISADFSRVWAFAWLISSIVPLAGSRIALAALVNRWSRSGLLTRNIVIYGAGYQGASLVESINRLNEPWNRILGVFDDRVKCRAGTELGDLPILGNTGDLFAYVREHRIDEILIAVPWNSEKRINEIVRLLAPLPVNIRLSPDFVGTEFQQRSLGINFGIPMLNILDKPVTGWEAVFKNAFDYILGVVFLILSLPLMVLIAIAIKLESKGPLLFYQKRYGFNHKLIDVCKFRTMYTDLQDNNAEQLTTRDDPRVTRVGAVLRRLSLDELPQLCNVLRGQMSVVGPRPHAISAKAGGRLYGDVVDDYAARHRVKPGITGWAQVNGWRGNTEHEKDILNRVAHDIYYIENWSVLFDLYIVYRTIGSVLFGKNSY